MLRLLVAFLKHFENMKNNMIHKLYIFMLCWAVSSSVNFIFDKVMTQEKVFGEYLLWDPGLAIMVSYQQEDICALIINYRSCFRPCTEESEALTGNVHLLLCVRLFSVSGL